MSADAILLMLLAIFDLLFLTYVRRRGRDALKAAQKTERIMNSLTMAVQREIGPHTTGLRDSARTDKLPKDFVREQHAAIG